MTLPAPSCEDQSQSLVRDSVGTTMTNGALTVVGILIWIAIARLLPPMWRGALALIMILPAIVMKVGTFGFDQGMVVIGGADRTKLSALARTSFAFGLTVGIICIAALIGFMWGSPKVFWHTMQRTWLPGAFMAITIAFPIHLMTMAFDAAIYAEDRIAARNKKELIVNVVMLVALLVLVLKFGLHLFGVIGAYLLANTVSLIYGWVLLRGRVSLLGPLRPDLLAQAIRLGFPVYLAQLASFVMLPAMMVVLSWQLPGDAQENLARIAFFTMSYQMVDRILPITRSIGFALLPKITGGTEEAARELAGKAGRLTLIVSVIVFAVLFVLMHPIVRILLGQRYIPVVAAFWVMAPGGIALSVGGVWATHLLARCKPLLVAWAGLAGVVAALAAAAIGFTWLPRGWEVMAASTAIVVGSIANSAVLLAAFTRVSGIGLSKAIVPGVDDFREWRRIPEFVRQLSAGRRSKVERPA